jgi:hypothetical protein
MRFHGEKGCFEAWWRFKRHEIAMLSEGNDYGFIVQR